MKSWSMCSMLVVGAAIICNPPLLGDSITLKPSVRVASDACAVRLGDIAVLEGSEALRWAELEVAPLPDPTKALEIDIRQVREVLEKTDIRWGTVELSGRQTIVRPRRSRDAAPLTAMQPARLDAGDAHMLDRAAVAPAQAWILVADAQREGTLRGAVAELVAAGLRVEPDALRLQFDGKDGAILETSASAFRFELEPISSFTSDRIELAVRFWSGQAIVQRHSLGLRAQVRVRAATLVRDVERGAMIDEAAVKDQEHWIAPPLTPGQEAIDSVRAVGRFAGSRDLKVGECLRAGALRKDMVVKRGDQVRVRCIVGGVCISMLAEARADGAQGDEIEFRKIGERQTFLARISGAGEAIVETGRG